MGFFNKLFGIKSEAEKEQLQKEWDEMKLRLKNKVSGLTKPAVHLIKTKNKTKSKFGGNPMVDNHDFVWPKSNNMPLYFLAQFDLNEISQQINYEWLSDTGSVLFFYDIEEMPWGFDPKDRGKWKVIYQDNPSIAFDHPKNLEKELIIKEKYIKVCKIELLPSFEDRCIQNLNLTNEETDLYIEFGEHYKEFDSYGESPAHQIGGFPQPIQGDEMQFEAQQASRGIYMGDGKAYQSAEAKDYESAKSKWKLLFQIDSDEELGIMWGDVGMLYFWVEQNKSISNDFENTWLILQCS